MTIKRDGDVEQIGQIEYKCVFFFYGNFESNIYVHVVSVFLLVFGV